MYFEVSARTGTNITTCFNEIAKKLTGIETNPINQSEIKNTGFTLNQATANPDGNTTDKGKGNKKPKCAC